MSEERREAFIIVPDNATVADLRRLARVAEARINLKTAETVGLRLLIGQLLDEIEEREKGEGEGE